GLSGLIVASIALGNGEQGYITMGQITGTIAALTTLCCCWGLAPFAKKAQRPTRQKEPITQQVQRILNNVRFLKVLGLY
ncbi:MAG: MFS transporter, partial [Prochlorococcus sp.]